MIDKEDNNDSECNTSYDNNDLKEKSDLENEDDYDNNDLENEDICDEQSDKEEESEEEESDREESIVIKLIRRKVFVMKKGLEDNHQRMKVVRRIIHQRMK